MGARAHILFNDFSAGEVSPLTRGRVTSEFYKRSCEKVENWWCRKEGGVRRRMGFQAVNRTYNAANSIDLKSKLVPFETSDGWFLLEFSSSSSGRSPVRVYDTDGRYIDSSGNAGELYSWSGYTFQMPASASLFANPNYTLAEDELRDVQFIPAINKMFVVIRSHCPVLITYTPGQAGLKFDCEYWEIDGNGYLADALDALGRSDIGPTPLKSRMEMGDGFFGTDTDDLSPATFRGVLDLDDIAVMTLTNHPSGDQYRYVARPEWVGLHGVCRNTNSLSGNSNIDCVIKFTEHTADDKMKGVTVDDSASASIAAYASFSPPVLTSLAELETHDTVTPFNSNDLGLAYMVGGGEMKITAVHTSSTARGICVMQVSESNLAVAHASSGSVTYEDIIRPTTFRTWSPPAWGNNLTSTYTGAVETGWPGAGDIFSGRLVLGGSKAENQSLWLSKAGQYLNFAVGPNAADAFQNRIGGKAAQDITCIFSGAVLFIGTKTSVFRGKYNTRLGPDDFDVENQLSIGADRVQPAGVGPFFVYVQIGGQLLRAVRYNDSIANIESFDATELASHITGTRLDQLATYIDDIISLIGVSADGHLCVGTFSNDFKVPPFSRFVTYDNPGEAEQAVIESATVIYRDGRPQVWAIVNRTIDDSAVRQLERIYFQDGDDALLSTAEIYLDNSVDMWSIVNRFGGTIDAYDGPGVRVTGLTNLAGQTVTTVLAGAEKKGLVVNGSGQLSVPMDFSMTSVSLSGSSGSVTVTFNSDDASEDYVGKYFILKDGGCILFTGYTSESEMTATVQTFATVTETDDQRWVDVTNLAVGVAYESVLKIHKTDVDMQDGTSQTRIKRLPEGYLRVYRTVGLSVRYEGVTEAVNFRQQGEGIEQDPSEHTGDFHTYLPTDNDREGTFEVVCDNAFRADLLMIEAVVDVAEG